MATLDEEHQDTGDLLLMGGKIGLDEGIEREETEFVIANKTRENVHHEETDGELFFRLVMMEKMV